MLLTDKSLLVKRQIMDSRGWTGINGAKELAMTWRTPTLVIVALTFFLPNRAYPDEVRVDLSRRQGVQEMVVSVKFFDQAVEVYRNFADYEVLHRGFAPKEQAAHWGLAENTVIEQAVLGAPGVDVGFLRLVKFHDVPQVRIRSSARPFDTGGIFNLNMRAKDLEGTFEQMRDYGFIGFADPTYYTFRGKRYGGAMLRGHDGVVINLLHRVSGDYSGTPPFDRVSHIINSTQMIGNFEDYRKNKEFFRDKLGWHLRFEGSPEWPEDGSNNMSLPNSLILEGRVKEIAAGFTFTEEADGGSIEIFAFDGISGRDYSSRAQPPNLGVLMYRVHVPDVDAYSKKLRKNGISFLRSKTRVLVPPYGPVKSLTIKAPSGAWIEFFQQE